MLVRLVAGAFYVLYSFFPELVAAALGFAVFGYIFRLQKNPPLAVADLFGTVRQLASPNAANWLLTVSRAYAGCGAFRIPFPTLDYCVVISDGETAKRALSSPGAAKIWAYGILDAVTGAPSVASRSLGKGGGLGASAHRACSAAFSAASWNEEAVHHAIDNLVQLVDVYREAGESLDVAEVMRGWVLDVLGATQLHFDFKVMEGTADSVGLRLLDALDATVEEFVHRQVASPWRALPSLLPLLPGRRRAISARADLIAVMVAILAKHRDAQREGDGTLIAEVLSLPYESDEDRAAELVGALLLALDATAYTLAWTLYLLARHPQEQRLLAEEIRAAVAENNIDRSTHIPLVPRIDRVLREAMRLYPAAAMANVRKLAEAVPVGADGRHEIAAGSIVVAPPILLFRQPWIHGPDRFVPDRWLPEAPQAAALRDLFVPFGHGGRACLGRSHAMLTMKACLPRLVENFVFEVERDAMGTASIATMFGVGALKPDGARLRVHQRL